MPAVTAGAVGISTKGQGTPYLAGGKVVVVSEFLSEVIKGIGKSSMHSHAMSENYPMLRTLQFITPNRLLFSELLSNGF